MSLLHFKEQTPERGIADYAIFPLFVYTHKCTDGYLYATHHWHEELEFVFVEEGQLEISLNGEIFYANQGEVFFLNSKDLHQISTSSKHSLHHAIVFKYEILNFLWHDHSTLPPLDKAKFTFDINDTAVVAQIIDEFKEATAAYHEKDKGYKIVIRAALLKIIGLLLKHNLLTTQEEDDHQKDAKVLLAKDIMTYIHENYHKKISINNLANTINMSKSYFCKFFKQMFGKTTVEYINQYRIEKACDLMKSSDQNIMDIATDVGFDNFSYFIRKFKEIKKITPSQYRKSIDKLIIQ
ncbi:MAG: AraC family transcriptional regulator [Defluviitaleaceae bacterium]|nr:AraC family transcriptional regulator [Defluviitaleaceae bacterium]